LGLSDGAAGAGPVGADAGGDGAFPQSSAIRQLENFAGVMNFVIFPMFFASTALYPLWRMAESSTLLHDICAVNPFTHAVELIRFRTLRTGQSPVAGGGVGLSDRVFCRGGFHV
jgi:hypothetical protein